MVSGPTVAVGAVARSKFPDPAPVVTVSFVGMSVPETVIPDTPTVEGKLVGAEVPVVARQLGEHEEFTSTLVTVSVSVPQVAPLVLAPDSSMSCSPLLPWLPVQ